MLKVFEIKDKLIREKTKQENEVEVRGTQMDEVQCHNKKVLHGVKQYNCSRRVNTKLTFE